MSTTRPGPEKAALVLLALDQDLAIEVLRHLDERDVARLARTTRALDGGAAAGLGAALEEFEQRMAQPVLTHDAGAYLRQLAADGLGDERAARLFSDEPQGAPAPLDAIRSARAGSLAQVLTDENPQLAAVVISQLPRERAVQVLRALPDERRADVLGRIAGLTEIPAELLALASQGLADALAASGVSGDERKFDGVAFAASLLNALPSADSTKLLETLEADQVPSAAKVREAMFTFDDLRRVDKLALQTLMREVPTERLLPALKTASPELRDHFLSAVSSRAAATLREDLAAMPPTRLSDVETAQREIVALASRLAQEGRLVLPSAGGEELV